MLEELINFKLSVARKEAKHIVEKKFKEYCDSYDNMEKEATIGDKIRHREAFFKYINYMANKQNG